MDAADLLEDGRGTEICQRLLVHSGNGCVSDKHDVARSFPASETRVSGFLFLAVLLRVWRLTDENRRRFEEKHVGGEVSSSDIETTNVPKDTKTATIAYVRPATEI